MTFNPPKDDSFNPDGASSVRVTLTGPTATSAQQSSASQGSVATPTLPQTFELVGYDSNNKAVIKYGFVLKQWFVNRGSKYDTYYNHSSWCSNIGGGYRMPQVKDLTNAKCGVDNYYFPCVNGIDGATPSSSKNNYQRNIGAGLFTEWGLHERLYRCRLRRHPLLDKRHHRFVPVLCLLELRQRCQLRPRRQPLRGLHLSLVLSP